VLWPAGSAPVLYVWGRRCRAVWNRVECHSVRDGVGTRFVAGLTAAAVLAVAGCASATGPPAADGEVDEPPLVGTEWQLASYQDPAAEAPVPVTTDSTLSFSAKGHFSARACNYIGGTAQVDGHMIRFGGGAMTEMACGGEEGVLETKVVATVQGSVDWSIRARTLTLTGGDGHVLTYRVRPSIYPNLTARTILAGNRDGGQFRLAVHGPSNRPFLAFEERTAPGEGWGRAGIASPGPNDCLANHVMGAGSLGGQTFLVAWATPDVAKVTTQATQDGPETALTFYAVPGSTLRIAGLWTASFRPSNSPVTFYDRNGTVIAAYPNGPC
jgi:heat shock protein HslJ